MIANWDVRTAAKNLGIELVSFESTGEDPRQVRGASHGNKVGISPTIKEVVFVVLHEFAHVVLGHTKRPAYLASDTELSLAEVEAHTIALVVADHLGLDDTEYDREEEIAYISDYAPAKLATAVIRTRAETLSKAASVIYNAGLRHAA